MKLIKIPEWFSTQMRFKAKWIPDCIECKIINFNPTTNLCEVEITTKSSNWVEDGWNLQHTLWGFENGDYKRL